MLFGTCLVYLMNFPGNNVKDKMSQFCLNKSLIRLVIVSPTSTIATLVHCYLFGIYNNIIAFVNK